MHEANAGVTPLPPEVRKLFEGTNTAHVATLMRDGAPHSVPMWIGSKATASPS